MIIKLIKGNQSEKINVEPDDFVESIQEFIDSKFGIPSAFQQLSLPSDKVVII